MRDCVRLKPRRVPAVSRRPPDRRPSYEFATSFSPLPQYRVVLRSRPEQSLMDVLRAILDLTRLCKEEATRHMWEAYYNGLSVVCVTHKERAEFVADQFGRRGITATIEPAA